MNEISQPTNIALVKPRDEGRGQGQGKPREDGPPPKKVADAYKETNKTKPVDDRITILGIPAEQITPATQAALASLVAEVNFLRAAVRRLDSSAGAKREGRDGEIIAQAALIPELSRLIADPLSPGVARVMVVAYLSTFEDVRRSSGLLAANTLLADLAQRMSRAEFTPSPDIVTDITKPAHGPGQFRFRAVGFAGGSTLVGLAELPDAALDETHVSRQVRDQCLDGGFNVAGIDMAVALSVAAVVMSTQEGALTAIGRADHLLRGSPL
jgi:hypothetical protein